MENQIIILLWSIICICYTGIGYLVTLKLIISSNRTPDRFTRFITIFLWPFMGLLAIVAPKSK